MDEEWKDIPGFEGFYQVSNFGRLKSFKEIKTGRVLSNKNKNGGYFSVVLSITRGAVRYTRMHRLVAEAFIQNPNGLPEVNHKDCNRQNDHIDNLEWVSKKQNIAHAVKTKPSFLDGMKRYNQKIRPMPIIQLSLDGSYIRTYANSTEAHKATGVCQRNILQVASGTEYKPGQRRMQAGGYNWLFMMTIDFDMDLTNVHKNNKQFIERKQLCAKLSRENAVRRSWSSPARD